MLYRNSFCALAFCVAQALATLFQGPSEDVLKGQYDVIVVGGAVGDAHLPVGDGLITLRDRRCRRGGDGLASDRGPGYSSVAHRGGGLVSNLNFTCKDACLLN